MAKSVDKITLLLNLKGFKAVKGLGQDFAKFKSTVKLSKTEVDKAIKGLLEYHGNTKLSTNALKGQISALTRLKDNVGINTKAYKRLSVALDEAKIKMNELTGASKKQGRFGALGTGAGAAVGLAGGYLGGSLGINPAITGLASVGAYQASQAAGVGMMSKAGLMGGLAGAGIGLGVAGVGALVASGKAAAEYSAQIKRLEVALKGVTKSQTEFNKAQKVIRSVSKELNVPIASATQQFTTLTASVIGAGGSVDEAEKVFRGVSEAIKATGGDAEDVRSAIRAMSQIFGKGKVSAEELQGQLGERLPGAVTKFALATNRTLPQLQKDLRDGTVGLNDVMKFVVKLSEDHAEAAKAMAKSSADAGQRMQVTFDELKKNVGDILQPIGARIQDMTEVSLNALNRFIEGLRKFMKIGDEFALENSIRREKELMKKLGLDKDRDIVDELSKSALNAVGIPTGKDFQDLINMFRTREDKQKIIEEIKNERKLRKEIEERKKMMDQILNIQESSFDLGLNIPNLSSDLPNIFAPQEDGDGNVFQNPVTKEAAEDTKKAKDILDKYRESVKQVNQDIANSFVNTFKKMEDALVEFVLKGTLNFRKLAQSIIADITRIVIRSSVIQPLTGMLGNLFNPTPKNTVNPFTMDFGGFNFGLPFSQFADIPESTIRKTTFGDKVSAFGTRIGDFFKQKFADGGVIPKNKIVPYAKGGLIERPTIFPLADGAAIAGEAGVEAIMPLRRGRGGRLGVEASGGGGTIVNVSVNADGSSVQGQEDESKQLGEVIAAAIQQQIIMEQRPGGLLHG